MEHWEIFATEGKDSATLRTFCEELLLHNDHPHSASKVAIGMSAAYQKEIGENMRNARICFDPFHVTALVGEAVDEARSAEAQSGSDAVKEFLRSSMDLFRKNPENLTESQAERFWELDLNTMGTRQAYQVRLGLSDIYRKAGTKDRARYRLEAWVNWTRAKCDRWGTLMQPLAKAVNTVEKHLAGILAHWNGELSTAFMEGMNRVFSAVKRKTRGFKSVEYLTTSLHFVGGTLSFPSFPSHGK